MTDTEAKIYIAQMRTFYHDLLGYGIVNGSLIAIWLFSPPCGTFWPGWTILGWGLLLAKRALDLGLISLKKVDVLPFMAADWEEKQLQKLVHDTPQSLRDSPEPVSRKKSTPTIPQDPSQP